MVEKKKTCVPLFDSGYSKEFSCSSKFVPLRLNSSIVFLFPIFPPPTTFSSYQSATEVEKSIMERICETLFSKIHVFTNFHKN